ncbi:hypothetical protein NLI96_g2132 [Meripilus lineatus]|uniref:Uncharacterized protein n=1 Tax=Meripilus lineatus TaxID=2056292 RepID=A0AAD5VEN1_9APHY|nr:hypothetical protein NLI96_g2132 [Physisporinus lineatus]
MSTHLDPMFLKKIQSPGFMSFKDRVEASLAFSRPSPKRVPLPDDAQRVSRMILELLEDNDAADEKNAVLTLLRAARSGREQRAAGLEREITLERKVEELTNGLRDRDSELEVTRAQLEASSNKVVELIIQSTEKNWELRNSVADFVRVGDDGKARFVEVLGRSDDREAKDRIIEESRDTISQLKARILQLENQLTVSVSPPTPVLDNPTLQVTTIVPLDIDDIPSSDVVPACNLPQDADYFARIAPEATYEGSKMDVDAGPDLLEPHCAKVLATRPQRRGVYKIRTPYSTTRLGVRGNVVVSKHDLITGEIINLGDPTKAPKPSVPAPGPRLRAVAPSFTPSLGQPSAQLRPGAPSFVPHPSVIRPPQTGPSTIPSFAPCQPPLRVDQHCARVGEFAPRPQFGHPPFFEVPWHPINPAFIPHPVPY